jgi:hypothetical protein
MAAAGIIAALSRTDALLLIGVLVCGGVVFYYVVVRGKWD